MQLSIRGATEADLDRLVEIHIACYPDARTGAQRRAGLMQGSLGGIEALRVVTRGDAIVGHGRGFSLVTYFGGQPVTTIGIASLGVAPEARRLGVGTFLVKELEGEARAQGAVLAMLHPFRHAFYGRLGYADVAPMRRLYVSPRAIPTAWMEEARKAEPRPARAADVARLVELHKAACRKHTGWNERQEPSWTKLFARERVHILVLKEGYVAFEIDQDAAHGRTHVEVVELVALTTAARRALWGVLGSLRDQVAEIQIEVADDDPVAFALTDIDDGRFGDERVEHELGTLVAGPMVRMLDVAMALRQRGYPTDGELTLGLEQERLHVVVRSGRAAVEPTSQAPEVTMTTRTLASVAFGGLSVRAAESLALVAGAQDVVTKADAILRVAPLTTIDRF